MHAVTDRTAAAESGVAHGEALVAFADAAVAGDDTELASARAELLQKVGPEAFVDAAAVVGNFERMDRIADSTGIPLDVEMDMVTEDIRHDLDLDRFASAANTPAAGPGRRALGRLLRPVAIPMMRVMGAAMRRRSLRK